LDRVVQAIIFPASAEEAMEKISVILPAGQDLAFN
jgi:hypothetical protein